MSVRALNRLGEAEVPGLGDALAALVGVEADLVAGLGDLRRVAEREAKTRRSHGVQGVGRYGEGYRAARQALVAITNARDSLSTQGYAA